MACRAFLIAFMGKERPIGAQVSRPALTRESTTPNLPTNDFDLCDIDRTAEVEASRGLFANSVGLARLMRRQ